MVVLLPELEVLAISIDLFPEVTVVLFPAERVSPPVRPFRDVTTFALRVLKLEANLSILAARASVSELLA